MAMAAGGGGVQSTPNVTPVIDVMLVLLIIFMVVAPALMAGFNATPPEGINLKDHPEDEQTDQVLGIDRDGQYYLNKRQIKNEDLATKLKQIFETRHGSPQPPLLELGPDDWLLAIEQPTHHRRRRRRSLPLQAELFGPDEAVAGR